MQKQIQNKRTPSQIQQYNKETQYLNLSQKSPHYWTSILRQTNWSSVKRLNLILSQINDKNIEYIAALQWPELTNLDLAKSYKRLTSIGIKKFIKNDSCNFIKLNTLSLWYANLGSLGVKYLLKINMPELKELKLGDCRVGDEGLKHITKAKWDKLQELILCYNNIDNKNIQYISHGNWGSLSKLNLNFNRLQPIFIFCSAILKSKTVVAETNVENQYFNKKIDEFVWSRYAEQ